MRLENAAGNDCRKFKKKKNSQQRTKQEKFREYNVETEMTFQRMSTLPKGISWVLLGHFHKTQSARVPLETMTELQNAENLRPRNHSSKESHSSKGKSPRTNFLKVIE